MSTEEFNDDEVRKILERAAHQQQASEARGLVRGKGTSLQSLEEIAAEVGIDAGYVKAAAREVALRRDAEPPPTLLGVPRRLESSRVIKGKINDEAWGRIVSEMRSVFGVTGHVDEFGEIREWASSHQPASAAMAVQVRLEPIDGGTLISIQQATLQAGLLPGVLGGSFMSTALIFIVLMLFIGFNTPLLAMSAVFGSLGALTGGVGLALGGRYVTSQTAKIEATMDRIERMAQTESEG